MIVSWVHNCLNADWHACPQPVTSRSQHKRITPFTRAYIYFVAASFVLVKSAVFSKASRQTLLFAILDAFCVDTLLWLQNRVHYFWSMMYGIYQAFFDLAQLLQHKIWELHGNEHPLKWWSICLILGAAEPSSYLHGVISIWVKQCKWNCSQEDVDYRWQCLQCSFPIPKIIWAQTRRWGGGYFIHKHFLE